VRHFEDAGAAALLESHRDIEKIYRRGREIATHSGTGCVQFPYNARSPTNPSAAFA
jgi:hypothetical protein